MAFIQTASDGLFAAIGSGLLGLVAMTWRAKRLNVAKKDAWQAQAEELRDELRRATQSTLDAYRDQVSALEVDRAHAATEIGKRDAEIARLNRLLNRQVRGGSND